jgi:asparagine synthase (glutamine-hydrolysing)
MCGIAGKVDIRGNGGPPVSMELLRRMASALRHRGPDEFGVYRDARAGLAHARLSIIDLSTGQQPITNEDQTIWIVFNGEIFNFVELRQELEEQGHTFRTHSDTEVVVHAYEEWGVECFPRFNGQWALALWDSAACRLTLSRDRIGIRPLYVREHSGVVWFGSEVKAIFQDPSVPRELDPRGLDQVFSLWAPVAPVSVFRGIEELPPAAVRVYENGGRKRDWIFWEPSYPAAGSSPSLTLPDAVEALREKLTRATTLRMLRADVPVGSYLSGGLDSSVTALMGRKAKQGDFRTFSIRFEDSEYDETNFQRMMAATIDSSHAEIVVTRKDIAQVFPEVVRHTERPIMRTAPAPLYLLSKLVRDSGIKAVLTGEGADEMLAGYDIFRETKIREFWSRQPDSKVRPRLFERLYPYLARSPQQTKGMAMQFWKKGLEHSGQPGFSHEPRWATTATLKKFFSRDVAQEIKTAPPPDVLRSLPQAFGRWDAVAQAQYLEIVTLLSSYIISSQGDRMLMAHSVEGRFPFLDVEVMDFCNSLPMDYKLSVLDEKHILKRLAAGTIPDPIINRKKQPYRAPDAISFVAADAPAYVGEMFSAEALSEAGIFNPGPTGGLYQKCLTRGRESKGTEVFSNTDNMGFIGILSTQLLYHHFMRTVRDVVPENIRFTTVVDRVHADVTEGEKQA